MKKCLLFLIFLPFLSFGQITKRSVLTSFTLNIKGTPLIGFSNNPDRDKNNSDFIFSIGNRTGKFFRDSTLMLGGSLNITYRKNKVFNVSMFSTSNTTYYEQGGAEKVYGRIGVFIDKYFSLRKGLYFSLSNDLTYQVGDFYYQTRVVDLDGNFQGITTTSLDIDPRIVYSFRPSVSYFLNQNHALTCSIGELDIELFGIHPNKDYGEPKKYLNLDVDFPAFRFGYTYRFNSNK